MRKHTNKWIYAIAGGVIIAAALTFAYYRHNLRNQPPRLVRRPLQHDASSVVDSEMLKGKFGNSVSTQERQVVEAALNGSDGPNLTQTQAAQTESQSGQQRIILTQPLATTVEDTEPTLTWDSPSDHWAYRVRIEDRDSHQIVATSAILDEAMWQVSSPLVRRHTYLWRVEASAGENHTVLPAATSPTGQFTILSDEGEQQIQNARAGNPSHLLLGSLYTHYGMWPQAVLEYRKLVSEVPDSPQAVKLLRDAELRSNAQLAATASR